VYKYLNTKMELLKDPGNTRVFKGLPLPPQRPLRSELLWQKGALQVGLLKEFLKKEGRVGIEDYKRVVREVTAVFSKVGVTQRENPT
jgi:hypothetical protein